MDETFALELLDPFTQGLAQEDAIIDLLTDTLAQRQKIYWTLGPDEDTFISSAYGSELLAELNERMRVEAGLAENSAIRQQHDLAQELVTLSDLALREVPEEIKNIYRQRRFNLIRQAIAARAPIEPRILNQYPSGTFADDLRRSGYQPELDLTRRLDDSLLERYGCRLRPYNGYYLTEAERDLMRSAFEELWEAVGDLSLLFRSAGLVIVYTRDRAVAGGYDPISGGIVIGPEGEGDERTVHTLGRELIGRWLDQASVPQNASMRRLLDNPTFDRRALTTSWIDARYHPASDLRKAFACMTGGEHQANSCRPSEIWPRLVSQYIAWLLPTKTPLSVLPIEQYYRLPGYWSQGAWNEWTAAIVPQQLNARLWMARQVAAKALDRPDLSKIAPSHAYLRVFPWGYKL